MTKLFIAAVIMASGFSMRMNTNKLLMDYRGKPLAAWGMDAVCAAKFNAAAVVTGWPEVARLAHLRGLHVIENLHPEMGQSQSVILGTRACAKADGILFVPADMPFLSEKVLLQLKEAFLTSPEAIIRPVYKSGDTRQKPASPVIFPKSLFGELCSLSGDRGGKAIILRHKALVREVYIDNYQAGIDIDTPEDVLQWLSKGE